MKIGRPARQKCRAPLQGDFPTFTNPMAVLCGIIWGVVLALFVWDTFFRED